MQKYISLFAIMLLAMPCQSIASVNHFSHKLDLQTRFDDRSARDIRYQYRVRYYPQYSFTNTWSINAFAVTGDSFSSSHNTIDDGSADYFYLRRLFVRHESAKGKTEMGVVPTFKGRVSSSGLSKDGWINGLRHVKNYQDARLELVLGQLDSLDPSDALSLPDELNYVELEYSAQIDSLWSFEVSAERITRVNYLRGELRFDWIQDSTIFAELVTRVDSFDVKTVLGLDGEIRLSNYPIEYFVHYSFVDDNFGLRAALTEDFLGTGHGFSGEIGGSLGLSVAEQALDWFVRYDAIESRTRFLAGVKWSWK